MNLIDELEFQRFHDLAIKIAEECDTLLDEQREVAGFVVNLRAFLVDLREMISMAVITDAGCTVDVPIGLYNRISKGLVTMEKTVGLDEATVDPVHVLGVAPLIPRRSA